MVTLSEETLCGRFVDASILCQRFGVYGQVQLYVRLSDTTNHTPPTRIEIRGPGPNRPRELTSSWLHSDFSNPI